jgi:RimJ/RimL family protein N-acetyltransferase
MDIRPVTLQGRFVRLEAMSLDHCEALAAIGLGHDIFRWYPFAVDTERDMLAWVRRSLEGREAGTSLPFTTIERATGNIVGSTSYLAIDRANRRLEIGSTWLGVPWQRSVCNTEAKYLQLRHCFEELGCIRVEFKTDSLNARSRAALLRIGAVEEGTFRSHMICPGGRRRDSVYFSIVDSEWPAVKQRLEGFLRQ